MTVITIIVALVSLWALFQFAMRLWDGNLPWGTGSRPALGLVALISFVAGALHLAAFHFEFGPDAMGFGMRFKGWSGPDTPMEYVERAGEWLQLYVAKAQAMVFELQRQIGFTQFPIMLVYLGTALTALYGISAFWRMSRGRFRPSLMEEVFLGWFASLGMAPFALVATGLLMAVVIILSIAVVGGMFTWSKTPVRRG